MQVLSATGNSLPYRAVDYDDIFYGVKEHGSKKLQHLDSMTPWVII